MYKRVLVTGSTAVAGNGIKAVQDEFPGKVFIFSSSKDCNLLDKIQTFDFIKKINPDAIIHLAAISGGIGLSINYPATLLRDNILMNFNILEAARICNIGKTIMTLSAGMYPVDAKLPLKEECIHDGAPHSSNYSYALAKRLIETAIRSYRFEYKTSLIGLVPNGIFGENDNFNLSHGSMVPSLVRSFYENKNKPGNIELWGDGTPLREYTYSKDLARAFLWCLDNYDNEQILNVGNTEEHTVKEIAYMIADIMEIDRARLVFNPAKPNGIYKKSTDNSKFIALSHFKYTPFRVGLENTIRWFIDKYENDRENLKISSKIKN
jgi:GDP-L-fucose synthase